MIIDREEREGNVIRLGNLPDRHFYVNFGVLIPKICVIQELRGAFGLDCSLKPRFRATMYNTIPTSLRLLIN